MKAGKIKGNFVKVKRIENGLSISRVAKKIGMSEATVYAIEAGDRSLSFKVVDKVMDSIGIDQKYRKFLVYPEDILERSKISKGEFLKLMRLEKGLNIPELAKLVGISVSTLSCIEIGTRNLTNDVYKRLADSLGLDGIKYADLDIEKAFIIYATDVDYKVPIIKSICLSKEEALKNRSELKKEFPNSVWRMKELSFDTRVKARNKEVSCLVSASN